MAKQRKPRLSFQIEQADKEAIDAFVALFPATTGQSLLLRAAVRLGIEAILQNPDRALQASTPVIPESLPRSSGYGRRTR